MISSFALILASISTAEAKCDSILRKVEKAPKDQIAKLYNKLNACDSSTASDSFLQFMKKANDQEALVELSIAAINADHWQQVGLMPSKIPESNYSVREAVTKSIGSKCKEVPKVMDFLMASYIIIGDNDFGNWTNAYIECKEDKLLTWLYQSIENPPKKAFDSKYNDLLDAVIKSKKGQALPYLEKAAISAANGGPYDEILSKMEEAISPGFGKKPSDDDKSNHQKALVNIAKQVGPEKAKEVAAQLSNAGADDKAAELMPSIYPDRFVNNMFTYAAASIEKADCKGEKNAAIHFVKVKEPGKRYAIEGAIEKDLRSFKTAYGGGLFSAKCDQTETNWPITVKGEPLLKSNDANEWINDLKKQLEGQGFKVKVKNESTINLK